MKKMNGWVIQLEEGVPEIECGDAFGSGWMQDTLRALRAWERRGMNSRLWKVKGRNRTHRANETDFSPVEENRKD